MTRAQREALARIVYTAEVRWPIAVGPMLISKLVSLGYTNDQALSIVSPIPVSRLRAIALAFQARYRALAG